MNTQLDFPHTCPDIDAAIEGMKDNVLDLIEESIQQIFPMIDWKELKKYRAELNQTIDIDDSYFEDIRSLNASLREQAEEQLSDASDEIEELERRIRELEEDLQNAENKIEDLELELMEKQ